MPLCGCSRVPVLYQRKGKREKQIKGEKVLKEERYRRSLYLLSRLGCSRDNFNYTVDELIPLVPCSILPLACVDRAAAAGNAKVKKWQAAHRPVRLGGNLIQSRNYLVSRNSAAPFVREGRYAESFRTSRIDSKFNFVLFVFCFARNITVNINGSCSSQKHVTMFRRTY